MTLRELTCIEVRCDVCGPQVWDNRECVPHWESQAAAVEALTGEGWRLDNDRQVCDHCAAGEDCARDGHQWSPWMPGYGDPLVEIRCCEHCAGGVEERFAEPTLDLK